MDQTAESIEALIDSVLLDHLRTDPTIKLGAVTVLTTLRYLLHLSQSENIPIEQISRELIIFKLTGKHVTAAEIAHIRSRIVDAFNSDDSLDALQKLDADVFGGRLLTEQKGTRRK